MRAAQLTAVAVIAIGGVSATALSAHGQDQTPRREIILNSRLDPRSVHSVDVRPRGPSAGDQFTYAASLSSAGTPAGRLEGVGIATDPRYDGGVQIITLALADGTLTVQGGGPDRRVPGLPRPSAESIFAVTGGTGSYTRATGTMSLRDINARIARITISLDG